MSFLQNGKLYFGLLGCIIKGRHVIRLDYKLDLGNVFVVIFDNELSFTYMLFIMQDEQLCYRRKN